LSRLARALLVGALAAAACSHPQRRPEPPPEEAAPPRAAPRPPKAETGVASYYARSLQGRRTASGERYDGKRMTCAHRKHPFGTLLRVTELESGKSVVVTVTDRGPFARNRVIDLSWAAARELGMIDRGVARVRIEKVERGELDERVATP
jgi:rare lipoprotein A